MVSFIATTIIPAVAILATLSSAAPTSKPSNIVKVSFSTGSQDFGVTAKLDGVLVAVKSNLKPVNVVYDGSAGNCKIFSGKKQIDSIVGITPGGILHELDGDVVITSVVCTNGGNTGSTGNNGGNTGNNGNNDNNNGGNTGKVVKMIFNDGDETFPITAPLNNKSVPVKPSKIVPISLTVLEGNSGSCQVFDTKGKVIETFTVFKGGLFDIDTPSIVGSVVCKP